MGWATSQSMVVCPQNKPQRDVRHFSAQTTTFFSAIRIETCEHSKVFCRNIDDRRKSAKWARFQAINVSLKLEINKIKRISTDRAVTLGFDYLLQLLQLDALKPFGESIWTQHFLKGYQTERFLTVHQTLEVDFPIPNGNIRRSFDTLDAIIMTA